MTRLALGRMIQPVHNWQHTGPTAGWNLAAEPEPQGPGFKFRLGRQQAIAGELLLRLLLAPPGQPGSDPFTHFNPLADANWLVSLIDSWAEIGDVLSFYQERNANEGFLSSAQQEISRRLLLATIAPPRQVAFPAGAKSKPAATATILPVHANVVERLNVPAAAAEIFAGLTVQKGTLKPDHSTIPAGTEISLHRVKDGQIAAFTITSGLETIAGASQLRPLVPTAEPAVDLARGATAIVIADAHGLKQGDRLFLRSALPGTDGLPSSWRLVTIASLEKSITGDGTLVTWRGPGDAPAVAAVQVETLAKPMVPFGGLAAPLSAASSAEKLQAVNSGGVLSCDAATGTWRTHNAGLPNADLADVALTPDGDVLLATSRGVYVAPMTGTTPYFAENTGLRSRDVTSFAQGADGMVYCSGTNGLVARSDDPQEGWSLILGNRSLVPPPDDSKGAVYTALPRTLVRRVRIGPVPGKEPQQTRLFTYALSGDGIFANGMEGEGWRLTNPPAPDAKSDVGIAQKSGRNIRDFLVFGDNDQPSILAATDRYLVHYLTNAGPRANAGTGKKQGWLSRFLHWLLPCLSRDATAAALPALGKWIDLEGRKVVEMAFVDWPKKRRQLLIATTRGVFAFHATTDGLELLDNGAPDDAPLAIAVPPGPLAAGSFGLKDTVVAVASYASGTYALTIRLDDWTEEKMPKGTWHCLHATQAEPQSSGATLVGSADPARTTALPHVAPRASFGTDGTLMVIAPMGVPDQWPGFHPEPDRLDLLPPTPAVKPGQFLLLTRDDPQSAATLVSAQSADPAMATGFGLPARQVQSVRLAAARSGPDPTDLSLDDMVVLTPARQLAAVHDRAVTDQPLDANSVQLDNPAPAFGSRHIGVFGQPCQAILPPGGGIVSLDARGQPALPAAGAPFSAASVVAITDQLTPDQPLLAVLSPGGSAGKGGILRSLDNGTSWVAVTLPWKGTPLDVDSWSDGALCILTTAALYLSEPKGRGQNWTHIADLPAQTKLQRIWAAPDGTVYASGSKAGLWRLQPKDGDWTRVTDRYITPQATVTDICWARGNRMYLALSGMGVLQSGQAGYQQIRLAGVGTDVQALAYDRTRGAVLIGSLQTGLHIWDERSGICTHQKLPGDQAARIEVLSVFEGANASSGWFAAGPGALFVRAPGADDWSHVGLGLANAPAAIASLAPPAKGDIGPRTALLGARNDTYLWSANGRPVPMRPKTIGEISRSAATWLDQSVIPATVQREFKQAGVTLPLGTGVQVLIPGQRWLVAAPAKTETGSTRGRMTSHAPSRAARSENDAASGTPGLCLLAERMVRPTDGITLMSPVVYKSAARRDAGSATLTDAAGHRLTLAAPLADVILMPPPPGGTEVSEITRGILNASGELQFEPPLTLSVSRNTAVMNANMCRAVEGRFHADMALGQTPQQVNRNEYTLPDAPLVFLRGQTRKQRLSTLSVTVDGQRWTEVADVEACGPRDRVYQVDLSTTAAATVIFGDGRHGQRPSAGHGAIRASFLSGQTTPAAPPAPGSPGPGATGGGQGPAQTPISRGQKVLATLSHVPNGISPVVATIWDKAEIPAEIVTDKPIRPAALPHLTAGTSRLLTARDITRWVEDQPGIASAQIDVVRRRGFQPLVGVALGGDGGQALPDNSATMTGLGGTLQSMLPSPAPRVAILPADVRHFGLSADIWLDERTSQSEAEAALRASIAARFGPQVQPVGAGVAADDVLATLQSARGVAGVVLRQFAPAGNDALHPSLPSRALRFDPRRHQFVTSVWWLPSTHTADISFHFKPTGGPANG